MPPTLGAELCVTSIQEPRPHFRNNISPALALQSEECAKSILMKIHPAKHARTNLMDQVTEMNAWISWEERRKGGTRATPTLQHVRIWAAGGGTGDAPIRRGIQ